MNASHENKTRCLTEEQRLAWLRLIRSENIGPSTFRDLLDHAGSAEQALEILPALSRRGGKRSYRLCSEQDAIDELEAHRRFGARLVARGEPDYPPHLQHIDSPPPLLSIKGGPVTSNPKMAAIVGARNASLSGRKLAAAFARDLGAHGFAIASGLARGIDAAAHEAAVPTGTVGVFAGGLNVLYPPEHGPLLAAIVDAGGAAISEMPFGWKPRGRDFPRRNRLISGVSLGVVVIEAAKASGSLHTARFALEQNRDIYAVPGSPLDPRSEGANGLIRQGATLARSARDVLEGLAGRTGIELPLFHGMSEKVHRAEARPEVPADGTRERIIEALGPAPMQLDELIRFMDADARTVNVVLLELELAGRLERHAGQKISLVMG